MLQLQAQSHKADTVTAQKQKLLEGPWDSCLGLRGPRPPGPIFFERGTLLSELLKRFQGRFFLQCTDTHSARNREMDSLDSTEQTLARSLHQLCVLVHSFPQI